MDYSSQDTAQRGPDGLDERYKRSKIDNCDDEAVGDDGETSGDGGENVKRKDICEEEGLGQSTLNTKEHHSF